MAQKGLFPFLFFFILLVTTTGCLGRTKLVEPPSRRAVEETNLAVRGWTPHGENAFLVKDYAPQTKRSPIHNK
ncbi:hypothetical protein SDJN02_03334 [Cucurbita argyrosperma subsp. argyrosperma]